MFASFGFGSVDDLLDPNLVMDDDLEQYCGMSQEQIAAFRSAVDAVNNMTTEDSLLMMAEREEAAASNLQDDEMALVRDMDEHGDKDLGEDNMEDLYGYERGEMEEDELPYGLGEGEQENEMEIAEDEDEENEEFGDDD